MDGDVKLPSVCVVSVTCGFVFSNNIIASLLSCKAIPNESYSCTLPKTDPEIVGSPAGPVGPLGTCRTGNIFFRT